ncbi:hypothetical protein LCGC14_0923440 [marine sediment metagenome]|uniref:Uncharacterized protein n=1 Tax=marine sediment metagenome TaxID=412755 RepID=A0A0F9PAT1_9ZZZZ
MTNEEEERQYYLKYFGFDPVKDKLINTNRYHYEDLYLRRIKAIHNIVQ